VVSAEAATASTDREATRPRKTARRSLSKAELVDESTPSGVDSP